MCLCLYWVGHLKSHISTILTLDCIGLVTSAAGQSVPQAMQGLVASFANNDYIAVLYSSIAMVELAGGMIGNVAFAALFDQGLHLGGKAKWGLGIPYWTATVSRQSSIMIIRSLCLVGR